MTVALAAGLAATLVTLVLLYACLIVGSDADDRMGGD